MEEITIAISEPHLVERPVQSEPEGFLGGTVEESFYLGTAAGPDALRQLPVQVEDTREGRRKHRREQAEALGQEAGSGRPGTEEVWELEYRIGAGDVRRAKAGTEWSRDEFAEAVEKVLTAELNKPDGRRVVVCELED